MSEGTLPFSSTEYDKLDHAVFPTIRRRDKYGDVGTVNEIHAGPKGNRRLLGTAEVIAKETVTLQEVNSQFFQFDTQSRTLEAAVDSINKFYTNPIADDEPLTLYWNKWVDRDNQTLTEWSE